LYFAPRVKKHNGLTKVDLVESEDIDLRIVDLYRGMGIDSLSVYSQPRNQLTDWQDVIDAIDRGWTPTGYDPNDLLEAFPLDLKPVAVPAEGSIFDHPLIATLPFQPSKAERRRRRWHAIVPGWARAAAPRASLGTRR
jgi:hypothetical protein